MISKSESTFEDSSFFALGVITRAHGIVGEVKVLVFERESTSLIHAKHLWLRFKHQSSPTMFTVTKVRPAQEGIYLVKFQEVQDRNQAEELEKAEVFVPRQELPPLEDNEIYLKDLIGYQVFQKTQLIGSVSQVLFLAGQDFLIVLGGEEQEIFIPYLPNIIVSVEQKQQKIEIDPPEGLLDLNRKVSKTP